MLETIADVAQELVTRRRLPLARYRTEWPGAKQARAAASDFRRTAFGLAPLGSRMGEGITEGEGVQLIIDTQRDTYEQAIAAVQAAYGFNPAPTTDGWPEAPALDPRPGPQDLSDDDLWEGWSERLLFDTLAALMPGARAVLRRIAGRHCYLRRRPGPLPRPPRHPDPEEPDRRHAHLCSRGTPPHRPGQQHPPARTRRPCTGLPHRARPPRGPAAGLRLRRRPARPAAPGSDCA